jgi:hypothetical protein
MNNKGNKNPNWKGGISKHYCIDCKKEITYYSLRCRRCDSIHKIKVKIIRQFIQNII